MTSLRCGWSFGVDSRSGRYRQEGYTLRSRSTSRDLLTGAPRPFEWSEGPKVPLDLRLEVRLESAEPADERTARTAGHIADEIAPNGPPWMTTTR